MQFSFISSIQRSFALHHRCGRLPGSRHSCKSLSEAVLLTPHRQHGGLAQARRCELKLWPWRHVGGRSSAVSTFSSPPPFLPLLCPAAAHHTLTSGHPPWGPGGRGTTGNPAHKSGEVDIKAKRGVIGALSFSFFFFVTGADEVS